MPQVDPRSPDAIRNTVALINLTHETDPTGRLAESKLSELEPALRWAVTVNLFTMLHATLTDKVNEISAWQPHRSNADIWTGVGLKAGMFLQGS